MELSSILKILWKKKVIIQLLIAWMTTFFYIHEEVNQVAYEIHSDEVIVASHRDGFSLQINFEKIGKNKLMQLSKITLADAGKMPIKYSASTDWVGPYMVKSLEDPVDSAEFTGGWHTKIVEDQEVSTAKTVDISTLVGGKKATTKYGMVDSLTMTVTNKINGYNTDSPVLQEIVTYTFTPNKVDVHVCATALKNISIEKYYGLQTQNYLWNQNIIYYSKNHEIIAQTKLEDYSDAPRSSSKPITSFEFSSTQHDIKLETWLDIDSPMVNQYEYVSTDKPEAFTRAYGKSYFNIVNEKPLELKKGESISWQGGYIFKK